ncbi:hypothetical protein P5V15_005560 [Pogonomyrmex californicus]
MASGQWSDDVAYAMTPFKLISWPIGVWPLQVYNIYSLIRCTLATCCAALVIVIPSFEVYLGCTDAGTKIDCLMLACAGILGMVKTLSFRIYARKMANNYGSAVNDYLTIENTEERAIMRRHTFMGRVLCCVLICFSYFSCMMYVLNPFLSNNTNKQINITNEDVMLEYPMPSKCAMKYFNAPVSMYSIFCLMESIALFLTGTANQGNDALFLNITLHVCGQVKILKNNFLDFDVKSPQIYDRFNVLINRHNYLIKLSRELAEVINFVLLIEFFLITILLCVLGFQFILALKVNNIIVMTKSLMVQITFLLQLTLYCSIGNYLISQMEEIRLAVYQSAWYYFPAKLTRHLIFIIMRSDSPVSLQAGNFIVVNLATCISIIKASFSYLSVLRVLVET